MNILPFDQQVRIIAALTEGCSIRSTERLLDVHRDSIMRLSVRVGEGCARLHDRLMRDLQVNLIELDEQWDFIAKKQRHVQTGCSVLIRTLPGAGCWPVSEASGRI